MRPESDVVAVVVVVVDELEEGMLEMLKAPNRTRLSDLMLVSVPSLSPKLFKRRQRRSD